jgi:hypothetical protein
MQFDQRDAGGPAFRTTTHNVNRELAEEIEPRRYQTNVNLNQPPTKAVDRLVREYVTNVTRQAGRTRPAA